MPARTYYIALPFDRSREGHLIAKPARECNSAEQACREAAQFGEAHAGALAFARVIDQHAGRTVRADILSRVGDLPALDYLL